MARAAKLPWTGITCQVAGTLDRMEGRMAFTHFESHVRLAVPFGTDLEVARGALQRAKTGCLVANSLRADQVLHLEIETGPQPVTDPNGA